MTFAYTLEGTAPSLMGHKWVAWGTFTNGASDTGGDIYTGLKFVEYVQLQHTGTAVVASNPVVNETLPHSGEAITIVSVANADGVWYAIGMQ